LESEENLSYPKAKNSPVETGEQENPRKIEGKGVFSVSNITELNEENFQQEVLNSTTPVLVDFWAPWCGPCQRIAPVVEELAAENAGRLKVGKVNVDQSPQLAAEYGVNGIPTLMVFKNGEVIRSLIGLQPKARLQEAINAAFE